VNTNTEVKLRKIKVNVDVNRAWENFKENIKTSAKESFWLMPTMLIYWGEAYMW